MWINQTVVSSNGRKVILRWDVGDRPSISKHNFCLDPSGRLEENPETSRKLSAMNTVNLRFGPYELKARFRELYKHGVKLKLRPQSFQVLQVLLERSGDLVTREDFRQRLWPSDTFVDFEHGLNSSVKNLRRVLNDSATEPRYIETLPKLGYRFIFPVEVLPESATASGELASRALRDTLAAAASPVFAPGEVASDAPVARTSVNRWRALLYTGIALVAILVA
ncbi:MAG: winged helix-turn-helix domain-containing protein, partial [Candidatus Acidiferrales bacterium]